jgi:hypothetical protein
VTIADQPPVFRRSAVLAIRAAEGADQHLRLVASTDEPCSMGSWTERLSHADGAIDWSTCRSLCINHDHDMIVGTVREFALEGGQLVCNSTLLPSARLESGVPVQEAVAAGALFLFTDATPAGAAQYLHEQGVEVRLPVKKEATCCPNR